MQKGDYESAMSRLQASLDLDATMYQTYYNLGVAAINANKYEKAIEALESGIKINPDYADFYYSLGVAQIGLADDIYEMAEVQETASADTEKDEVEIKQYSVIYQVALLEAQVIIEPPPDIIPVQHEAVPAHGEQPLVQGAGYGRFTGSRETREPYRDSTLTLLTLTQMPVHRHLIREKIVPAAQGVEYGTAGHGLIGHTVYEYEAAQGAQILETAVDYAL